VRKALEVLNGRPRLEKKPISNRADAIVTVVSENRWCLYHGHSSQREPSCSPPQQRETEPNNEQAEEGKVVRTSTKMDGRACRLIALRLSHCSSAPLKQDQGKAGR
jgi:hypothetical protein